MQPSWTEAELGWAAGAIDGEGCICVYRAHVGNGRNELRLIVAVNTIDRRMPAKLHAMFGGRLVKQRPSKASRGQAMQMRWFVAGRYAGLVLRVLMPHFVIKREQASLAIAYADTVGRPGKRPGHAMPPEVTSRREQIRAKLALIKRELPAEGMVV